MENNHIDLNFKNTFKDREITPKKESWEKIVLELENQQQKKNKRTFYRYVASVLLIVGLITFLFKRSNPNTKKINIEVVDTPINNTTKNIENLQQNEVVSTLVKTEKKLIKQKKEKIRHTVIKKSITKSPTTIVAKNNIILKKKIKAKNNEVKPFLFDVNPDVLLASVEESMNLDKKNYKQLGIIKQIVLDSIKIQLASEHIEIPPMVILEKIEDDLFFEAYSKKNLFEICKTKVQSILVSMTDNNEIRNP